MFNLRSFLFFFSSVILITQVYANEIFFIRTQDTDISSTINASKTILAVTSNLRCLAYCHRDDGCVIVTFDKLKSRCSLYNNQSNNYSNYYVTRLQTSLYTISDLLTIKLPTNAVSLATTTVVTTTQSTLTTSNNSLATSSVPSSTTTTIQTTASTTIPVMTTTEAQIQSLQSCNKSQYNMTQPLKIFTIFDSNQPVAVTDLIEISSSSMFFVFDSSAQRILRIDQNLQYMSSHSMVDVNFASSSARFIYITKKGTGDTLVQLDFSLNLVRVILNGVELHDIEYDIITDIFYVVSFKEKTIRVYNSLNNETNFTLNHSIAQSNDNSFSLTLDLGILYLGDKNANILVYNATSFSQLTTMSSLCSSSTINSIKFDCSGNMAYSCSGDKSVNIKYKNGTEQKFTLTNNVYAVMFDSENRLWAAIDGKLSIYN